MSSPDYSPNPYSAPNLTQPNPVGYIPPSGLPAIPPKGVTVVGVLYTVFGVLGVFGLFGALLGLVWAVALSLFDFGMPEDQVQLQREMLPWSIGGSVFSIINGIVAGFLLVSGIRLLKRKRSGAELAAKLFALLMGLEIFRIGFMITQQIFTMGSVRDNMMNQMNNQTGPGAAGATEFVEMIFMGSMIVAIIFTVGYSVAKIIMYIVSNKYLKRPEVAATLEN